MVEIPPLPRDLPAERAVLGACIQAPAVLPDAAESLSSESFFLPAHAAIWRALVGLQEAGTAIDLLTLRVALMQSGELESVGGEVYIASLVDGVPRATNVAHYAKRLQALRQLRDTMHEAVQVLAQASADDAEAEAILDASTARLLALADRTTAGELRSAEDVAQEVRPVIEDVMQRGAPRWGVRTGIEELDRKTRGFHAGQLVLIAARPAVGKSSLALTLALGMAAQGPIAFFSLEMSREELGLRAVAAMARVDAHAMMSGWSGPEEQQRISEGLYRLAQCGVWFDDSAAITVNQARTRARRLRQREKALAAVVIDYLGLMRLPEKRTRENRNQEVAEISRSLKLLAKDLGVPVIALSQLSRAPEQRTSKRPQLSDLRDSGALEQDADVVLMLHRPNPDDPGELGRVAEMVIAKQRNGPTGVIDLVFLREQMRFVDAMRRTA